MIRQKLYPIVAIIVFVFSIWYVFYDFSPQYSTDFNAKSNKFSTDRAFKHVEAIADQEHFVGTAQHSLTRNYIVEQLEDLGLKVHTQQGFSLNALGEFTIPENIIAKIEGQNPKAKSLLLLSHYDSEPHSSFGASDAASGIAAILEATRAFLENGKKPKHDIIICFTDAEEVGLLGATLFVDQHPWAKNIGLVLNFESRGSGGPSNMILETNHGNSKMIKAFAEAEINHPLATSLMYSVYKILPNDTDSTVFREKADIPSFFFAFIDDHYDYHTALDIPQRLDKSSLSHQGEYAFGLLNHFSQISLDNNLKSNVEMVYFNLPELGTFYYPFDWMWWLYTANALLFLAVLYFGLKTKSINRREVFLGILPFTISLTCAFLLGFFGWKALLWFYPQYSEILQGFPYNGHNYIFAFVSLSLWVAFLVYRRFHHKLNPHNALVAPIVLWFLICAIINIYLPGASYFILPLGFGIIAFAMSTFKEIPNLFVIWTLGLPCIGLIVPLIQFFPVGLGLNMLVISTVFSVLVFGILYSFIGYLPFKKTLAIIFFLLGVSFLIVAHVNSDFNRSQPKPNSLVYLLDKTDQKAYWNTYDNTLDSWNQKFFEDTIASEKPILQSKYLTGFTYTSKAQYLNLKSSDYDIVIDSLENDYARIKLNISPLSQTKRIELYMDKNYNFREFKVNQQQADSLKIKDTQYHVFKKRAWTRLLTYHVVNQEELNIEFEGKLPIPPIKIYETRFDLLKNEKLNVPKRTPSMIPKPFVVNDAIVIKNTVEFESTK
ncbi:M20/M25/M40 family metallo-hydrolase [Mesohalobacter halotolerans]|uniref:M20/M25/M40 family metallo-hydrolase n=1 Tax=Mesohalobacter halotolerans TaxID=1883405 RepID=UPI001FE93820|nr:M20/M25/M40 family metallo-hydrolase [Mesohalobacter halotolerans]